MLKWLVWMAVTPTLAAMRVQKNPVARVTDLLERLQDKVEKQGKDEAKLWETMQCNCKKTSTNLEKSVEQEEARLPLLRSDHAGLGAQKARFDAEKERAVAERKDAQTALSSAQELRQKEAKEYKKLKEEMQGNLEAIGKAISALKKGLAGSFLQTDEAEELRQVVSTANLRLSDRDALASMLAGEMPPSSTIVGILQSMRDSMEEDQTSAESREAEARSAFDGMATAKRSQISTLATEIEAKTSRIGELKVDLVNKQEAIDSSAKKLEDSSKLLADTKETCEQQEQDWQERSQSRAEEMHAIQETLSLLGDDKARELFRKAMSSKAPSFLQVSELESGAGPQLALLVSAMRSGNINFKKIQDKITDMIRMLKQEQIGADRKFQWCKAELRSSKEKSETLEQSTQDLTKIMDEVKADQLQAQQDVVALTKNIKELDQQMDSSLKQRQDENAEYKEALATDGRAIDLLKRGKDRLSRFYAEKPKKSLLAQHRLLRARAQGISGLSVVSESSAVLPEAFGEYEKQPGDVVLGMLDKIVVDIKKDMKALEKQEKDAQKEFEKGTKDAQQAREEATRSLAEKSGVKAGLEKRFQGLQVKQTSNAEGKENAEKYLQALKEDCDDRVKNYKVVKASNLARQNRLENAKTLLAAR